VGEGVAMGSMGWQEREVHREGTFLGGSQTPILAAEPLLFWDPIQVPQVPP
jgi:hypothetical protein